MPSLNSMRGPRLLLTLVRVLVPCQCIPIDVESKTRCIWKTRPAIDDMNAADD